MNFFKKPYTIRRFLRPVFVKGYSTIPYTDLMVPGDVQTLSDDIITTSDGSVSVKRLKVFCDEEIQVEDMDRQQKADRIYYQGKWFECKSSRLSENTPLRHYIATFTELLDSEPAPEENAVQEGKL